MGIWDLIYRKRSLREQRFIGTASVVGLTVLIINFIVFPIWDRYQSYRDDVTTQSALLKRYQNLINTSDKAREKLFQTRQMANSISGVLLNGTTGDLASAELQGLLKNIASRANITFSSIKPNKGTSKDGFYEVSLTIPFSASIKQIQQFLFEIDQAPQLLYVKLFQIKSQRKDKGNLSVELEIAAYIRDSETTSDATKKTETSSKTGSEDSNEL